QGRLNKFPIGNVILLSMFSMALTTAVLFIVFPLLRYRRAGLQTPAAMPVLVYFSLLGAGYIAVQIILIQRFTLFIGYPTQAVTTIIASMLAFSALGSLLGQRFCHTLRHLQLVLAAVAALVLVYIVALPPVFAALLHLPDSARMVISAALVAPLAMVMGVPFPTALRRLGEQANELVPWAWGMNGIFSVLGSVLVIMLSMTTSFTIALVGGSLCYGAALLVSKGLWQAQLWQAQPSTSPADGVGLPAGAKKTA
ncbi:MAG: hypothetical protein MUD01_22400, partial [Chloroflexaceae bacterium]|nr:hypothetical protein [Chloroflexaceae bacterium]